MLEIIIPAVVGAFFAPVGAILFNSLFNGRVITLLGGLTKEDLEDYTTKTKVLQLVNESSQIHIESGVVKLINIRGKEVKGDSPFMPLNEPSKKTQRVEYNKHRFSEPPKIALGLVHIDTDSGQSGVPVNPRIMVFVEKDRDGNEQIGVDSFTLGVETFNNSFIHVVGVSWIAYGV